MIKATMNQKGNVTNPYQTSVKKVLCVCSAGLLRSPTLANILHKEYGYNTRACGVADYALIPLSEALLLWADEVVFVDSSVVTYLDREELELVDDKSIILKVPDIYPWNNESLQQGCLIQYKEYHENNPN